MIQIQADVAIVGAGIVGLAHAWSASRRGLKVAVFERSVRAEGASIRNFGMIWPMGQPAGRTLNLALKSRARWLDFINDTGICHNPHGSLHLATRADEMAVLEEFARDAERFGYQGKLLTRAETLAASPAAHPDTVIGGYSSQTEIGIDPPQAVAALARWLQERHRVQIHWNQTVIEVENGALRTSSGVICKAPRILICSGADLNSLFPSVLQSQGVKLCKLQMLATVPQPSNWSCGPMIASGLTLQHYAAFERCPSLIALKKRIATETPELNHYGIHVMAAQHANGEIIIGDSHEYNADISPFNREEIDSLILRELQKIITLPDWRIARRWSGIYGKLPDAPMLHVSPMSGVHLLLATGGAGMTMSFGLAEELWDNNWSTEK